VRGSLFDWRSRRSLGGRGQGCGVVVDPASVGAVLPGNRSAFANSVTVRSLQEDHWMTADQTEADRAVPDLDLQAVAVLRVEVEGSVGNILLPDSGPEVLAVVRKAVDVLDDDMEFFLIHSHGDFLVVEDK